MHLYHMHSSARSIDGREIPLMPILKETLKFIAGKALEKLKEQVGKVVPAKIRWVLTVPALWSEEHKVFMRKAAVEAGLIDSVNSPNLLLSLEVFPYFYVKFHLLSLSARRCLYPMSRRRRNDFAKSNEEEFHRNGIRLWRWHSRHHSP